MCQELLCHFAPPLLFAPPENKMHPLNRRCTPLSVFLSKRDTFSSNKHFTEWGELLSDHVLATALLDRLLHYAYVINIRGNTYRLKDRLKGGTLAGSPIITETQKQMLIYAVSKSTNV